jgi:hypothetical protein
MGISHEVSWHEDIVLSVALLEAGLLFLPGLRRHLSIRSVAHGASACVALRARAARAGAEGQRRCSSSNSSSPLMAGSRSMKPTSFRSAACCPCHHQQLLRDKLRDAVLEPLYLYIPANHCKIYMVGMMKSDVPTATWHSDFDAEVVGWYAATAEPKLLQQPHCGA